MSYNGYHNAQVNSLTYDPAHSCRDMQHTPAIRLRNWYGYTDGKALQSEQFIEHNCPYDNQYQKVHDPNVAFNYQVTPPINLLEPVVSEASP